MDNKTFGMRLRSARRARSMTQKELATLIGATDSSISNWENDQNRPDPDTISLILGALDIEATDLLPSTKRSNVIPISHWANPLIDAYAAAEVPVRQSTCRVLDIDYVDPEQPASSRAEKPSNVVSMAEYKARTIQKLVYNDPAAAGVPLSAESDYDHIDFPEDDVPYNADFGIRISGMSMAPDIQDGDIVWVHKQTALYDGEVGVFMIDGDAVCKRARVGQYSGLERLESDNKEFPDIICANLGDDVMVRAVGRVVGTYREGQ